MSASDAVSHRWRFYRAGGVDQVLLDHADDLLALPELDQKLWVALSCPVKGLEFDERTLALLDVDGDGRVRAPELVAAVVWLKGVLQEPSGLALGTDGIPLSTIRTTTSEGQALFDSARRMLEVLGKPDHATLTVDDVVQATAIWARAPRNGDGVVPPAAMPDEEARRAADDCLRSVGGSEDRSGQQGVTAAGVQHFFAQLAAYASWHDDAEARAEQVLPLGAATVVAVHAVDALAGKVEDWFVRSRLAAFEPRTQATLHPGEQALLDVLGRDLSVGALELRRLPLARVETDRPLDLAGPVNPAWQVEVDAVRAAAIEPLLGQGTRSLTFEQWRTVQARLEPYRAWRATRAGEAVAPLGLARVRELLASDVRTRLEQAVADDVAVAPQWESAVQVERLVRFWRDLFRLANNFVSFSDFYARRKAIFQAGTLHLDARTTDLCVQVLDLNKHAALAIKSGAYLVYVECARPGCEKMIVACALTAGDSDMIFVGRNGIFYDRNGRDWDATVTKIVEHPISVGQAFWSPYKKLARWLEDTVAKRAAAADEETNAMLQTSTVAAASGAPVAPGPVKPTFDVGVVAALGVAVGGITAALGALLQAFFGLGVLMPFGVLGALLLISGPAMCLAWLKLRKRNIGPMLDANGWAMNTHTTVNIPLGRSLTSLASLPQGSSRSLVDPYAPERSRLRPLVTVLALLALYGLWRTDVVQRWLAVPG